MKPVKNSHYSDLIRRLLFLLGALIVYRFGSHIPVPGVDLDAFTQLFKSQQGGILGVLNVFSGGALGRSSIFALNVMPYISASIIMQLLTVVLPSLEAMKKEGPSGQRRITRITRYATLGLALFQSYAISAALQSNHQLVPNPGFIFIITTMVSLTTGTMFLMWLGEQITERGIGNGISLIIFAGIAAGLPNAIGGIFNLVSTGAMHPLVAILVCILALAVTAIVVFVEKGLRKIPINHPGRQMVGARSSGVAGVLPLKLNMPGVIPPIFASSLILFPATIAGFSSSGSSDTFGGRVMEMVKDVASALTPGQPLYLLGYAALIIFFCFFYTALVFNSKQVADDLKRGGGLVPGIRPGDQTARYIDRVLMRLTFSGALYVTAICLLPEFLRVWFNVPFYFGGTSLLIVVVVAMDFMQQTQAYLMSHQYEGLLKKTNFKTR